MRIILNKPGPRFLPILVVAGLVLAGCGGGGGGAGRRRGPVDVVASVYPLAEVARQVGGERVRVTDLTPPGVEPHDLELSTRDVEKIEEAGVILYLGNGFQPAVEAVAERSDAEAIDVLAEVPVERDDPHVWLDPTLMARIVDVTQAALTEADPTSAPVYEANADAYRARLAALDGEYRAGLADCERRAIVTAHDAFGYVARRYGLTTEAIAGLEPEAEPDPKRLAELVDVIRRTGATTIFTEALVPPDVAETLARETGAGIAVLDPVESLSEEQLDAGETYVSVMQANLPALRDALGCS